MIQHIKIYGTNGMEINFEELANLTKDRDVKYVHYTPMFKGYSHLGLSTSHHPWSIKQIEAQYINSFIKKHNLKAGFEVATGTGVSAFAAATAFRETGGKLITMDAYIEEHRSDSMAYAGESRQLYRESNGYKMISFLKETYDLPLEIEVGWSPDDTSTVVEKYLDSVDYVFIDALHTDEAVLKDLKAIEPYVNKDKYAIFLHDTHAFSSAINEYLITTYGKPFEVCEGCSHTQGGFNLSVVTNL